MKNILKRLLIIICPILASCCLPLLKDGDTSALNERISILESENQNLMNTINSLQEQISDLNEELTNNTPIFPTAWYETDTFNGEELYGLKRVRTLADELFELQFENYVYYHAFDESLILFGNEYYVDFYMKESYSYSLYYYKDEFLNVKHGLLEGYNLASDYLDTSKLNSLNEDDVRSFLSNKSNYKQLDFVSNDTSVFTSSLICHHLYLAQIHRDGDSVSYDESVTYTAYEDSFVFHQWSYSGFDIDGFISVYC